MRACECECVCKSGAHSTSIDDSGGGEGGAKQEGPAIETVQSVSSFSPRASLAVPPSLAPRSPRDSRIRAARRSLAPRTVPPFSPFASGASARPSHRRARPSLSTVDSPTPARDDGVSGQVQTGA